MLKFTSIVGYTSCGPTYIESFFTIFGQCINVLNYNVGYVFYKLFNGLKLDIKELNNFGPQMSMFYFLYVF